MKSVRDFIAQDMWSHILMSGPDIRGCVTGEKYGINEEKLKYCQGIFTVFPHMLLGNFSRWLWADGAPKDYQLFMEPSVQALQAEAFPILDAAFAPGVSEEKRGAMLIPLLTDVIPKHVLTGFYDFMFAGQPDYKDISGFFPTVEPILSLTARGLTAAYSAKEAMPIDEKAEMYLFVGTRLPFLLIKRWYDWQFGTEKLEMPPPPPGK